MAIKASTGLRNHMLGAGSLKSALDGGRINIYSGVAPATADAAIGGATLLCSITLNSTATGIDMDTAASAGVLSKAPGQVWSGVNVSSGIATWYRHVGPHDDGTSSISAPRLQGEVALSGSDLNISNTSLTAGATQTIDFYSVALPTL